MELDEETRKLLQNMAQQQARMAEASSTTIDKKPFTVNLHLVYVCAFALMWSMWTAIGWIKGVEGAIDAAKKSPVEVDAVKTNVAIAQGDIKDLRRISTETTERVAKQEKAASDLQDAIRGLSTNQEKILTDISSIKKDVTRILESRR